MKPPLTARVTAAEHVLVQETVGEMVLLSLETGAYYTLDDVGTRMWRAVTSAPSIAAACDTMLAEYDVDRECLEDDLVGLVERLVDEGLVYIR